MSRSHWAVAALLAATTFATSGDAKLARTGTPQVAFNASGPAGMKLVGTTNELEVDDLGTKLVFRVPLKNLTTGIALRDRHMRYKYLQIDKYPNAELTVERGAIHFPNGDGTSSGDTSGSMTIHGKTKDVSFHYVIARASGAFHTTGSVQLDIRDYGIEIPSYLGVTVKPGIDVAVRFDVTE